jgi:hypothetical protein
MEPPEYLRISSHNSIDHPSQPYERIVIDSHFARSHVNTSVLKSKWVKNFKIVEGIDSIDIFNFCLQ